MNKLVHLPTFLGTIAVAALVSYSPTFAQSQSQNDRRDSEIFSNQSSPTGSLSNNGANLRNQGQRGLNANGDYDQNQNFGVMPEQDQLLRAEESDLGNAQLNKNAQVED